MYWVSEKLHLTLRHQDSHHDSALGSAPKIDISVTSLPKDVLNGMTDKESLTMIWRQWMHIANIKNALEMDRLNKCNVDVNGLCPWQSSFIYWLCLCSGMHMYCCVLKVWPALVRWWVKMCSLCMNKQMWKKKGRRQKRASIIVIATVIVVIIIIIIIILTKVSLSWQFCSLFQSEFSGECDLRNPEKMKLTFWQLVIVDKFPQDELCILSRQKLISDFGDVGVMVTACQKSVSL